MRYPKPVTKKLTPKEKIAKAYARKKANYLNKKKSAPKKKLITKVKKACDILFSKYIRLRDGECQRCGSVEFLQNSHTIPRSRSKHLVFNEINCIALCIKCHLYFWHKNPLEATEWFKQKFPDRYDYLMKEKEVISKMSYDDYVYLRQELAQKISNLNV